MACPSYASEDQRTKLNELAGRLASRILYSDPDITVHKKRAIESLFNFSEVDSNERFEDAADDADADTSSLPSSRLPSPSPPMLGLKRSRSPLSSFSSRPDLSLRKSQNASTTHLSTLSASDPNAHCLCNVIPPESTDTIKCSNCGYLNHATCYGITMTSVSMEAISSFICARKSCRHLRYDEQVCFPMHDNPKVCTNVYCQKSYPDPPVSRTSCFKWKKCINCPRMVHDCCIAEDETELDIMGFVCGQCHL